MLPATNVLSIIDTTNSGLALWTKVYGSAGLNVLHKTPHSVTGDYKDYHTLIYACIHVVCAWLRVCVRVAMCVCACGVFVCVCACVRTCVWVCVGVCGRT